MLELFDHVELSEDFESIKKGAQGTIVLVQEIGSVYLVELGLDEIACTEIGIDYPALVDIREEHLIPASLHSV